MELLLKEFKINYFNCDEGFGTDSMKFCYENLVSDYDLSEKQYTKLFEYFNNNWERV